MRISSEYISFRRSERICRHAPSLPRCLAPSLPRSLIDQRLSKSENQRPKAIEESIALRDGRHSGEEGMRARGRAGERSYGRLWYRRLRSVLKAAENRFLFSVSSSFFPYPTFSQLRPQSNHRSAESESQILVCVCVRLCLLN